MRRRPRSLLLLPLFFSPGSPLSTRGVSSDLIRVVASDVDGTLLNSQGMLSARTAAAIRRVQAAGAPFIVATGKCRAGALAALGAADSSMSTELAELPGVFTNGLQVFQSGGRLAWQALLEPSTVSLVEDWARERFDLVAYSGDRLLTTQRTARTDELHLRYREPNPEVHPSLAAMAARAKQRRPWTR